MSTIKVDTLVAADGSSAVTLTKQSAAKAWSNYDGQANTIKNSFNASSLTDRANGEHTVSFSNSFNDAYYSSAGSSRFNLTDADVSNRAVNYQPATGSVNVNSFACTTGGLGDEPGTDSQHLGDLA